VGIFNFSEPEILTFFAVLVRYSVLIAVLPFTGDRTVPVPAKVLFALAVTMALYPALVRTGQVHPADALVWGATTGGIIATIVLESLVGLVLGFVARLLFDTILFAGNLTGQFMEFATASMYDPQTESQSQVIAQFQMAVAMLIFLAIDGHHLMLRAALGSYAIVGLGKASFGAALSTQVIAMTGQVFKFGLQITAPIAITLFAVNTAFGVLAKAMPSVNILVLSFAITAFVGLAVMFLSMPEFAGACTSLFGRIGDWMTAALTAMAH
jgi:flagellar biosynthetic protein FliR